MALNSDIQTLIAEIDKSLAVLNRIERYILDFEESKLTPSPGIDEAMMLTQALTNYYTCLETIFLRISKYFENKLDKEQWHRSLLEKMVLNIEGIRPNVISENVFQGLQELLKFRHFSRYYFEMDYDWDKLHFLLKKFNDNHILVKKEVSDFKSFLVSLIS